MNAFDLVVTVALGSTFASILLNKDVSLAQGALAMVLLIGLQFLVTWTRVRGCWVRRLVNGEPALLLHRGQFLHGALRAARVTEDEVRLSIRSAVVAHRRGGCGSSDRGGVQRGSGRGGTGRAELGGCDQAG